MQKIQKGNESKGITLIALVITIIVMLILAGVAMSMISADGGIFTKTREATNKYNSSVFNEAKTMDDLMAALIETETVGSIITPTTATQEAKLRLSATDGYTPQYKMREEDDWTKYTTEIPIIANGCVYTSLKDESGRISSTRTINITNIDREKPNDFELEEKEVTGDSISITVKGEVTDKASEGARDGIAGIRGYQYKIDNGEWLPQEETTEKSWTFSGLEPESTHTVSMRAVDLAGNQTEATNKDYIIKTLNGGPKVGDYIEYSVDVNGVTYNEWVVFGIDQDGTIEIITLNGPNKVFGGTESAEMPYGESDAQVRAYKKCSSYKAVVNYVNTLNSYSTPFALGTYGESARHLGTYKENPANRRYNF